MQLGWRTLALRRFSLGHAQAHAKNSLGIGIRYHHSICRRLARKRGRTYMHCESVLIVFNAAARNTTTIAPRMIIPIHSVV